MNTASQQPATRSERRYDLDWLRVLTILTVFVFHSFRFFDLDGWHVKNASTYLGIQIWTNFLVHWMMPLVFVISGVSTFFALGTRGAGRFVKDRVLRLLVPLLVGIFTHVMAQVYLERLSHGQFSGTFLEFVPHYFDGMYGFGGNFAWMGLHLWYLEILFVFSVLLLPFFLWLKHGTEQRGLTKLAGFLARRLAVYLLALPIMLLLVLLDTDSILGRRDFGGWSLVSYILFFIYGFLLVAHAGLQQSIRRQRWLSLILGVALVLLVLCMWTAWSDPVFGTPRFGLFFSLYGFSSWCWILAILGFGMEHLHFNSPRLRYANEAVLPFYVLHQSILIGVGYFVVQWPLPGGLKWLIIAPTSFAIIAFLYEFFVKRVDALRFLFGLKRLPKATAAALVDRQVHP